MAKKPPKTDMFHVKSYVPYKPSKDDLFAVASEQTPIQSMVKIDYTAMETWALAKMFKSISITTDKVDYDPHPQSFTITGIVSAPIQLAHHRATFKIPAELWHPLSMSYDSVTIPTTYLIQLDPPPPLPDLTVKQYLKPYGDYVHLKPDKKVPQWSDIDIVSGTVSYPKELVGSYASAYVDPYNPPAQSGQEVILPLSHVHSIEVPEKTYSGKLAKFAMYYGSPTIKLSDVVTPKAVSSPHHQPSIKQLPKISTVDADLYRITMSSTSTQLTYVPKVYAGPTPKQVIKALVNQMDNVADRTRVTLHAEHKGRTKSYIGYWYLAHEWLGGLEGW